MRLIVINQTFPPEAYIFHTHSLFPYLRDTLSPLSCRVAFCQFPSRTSARIEIGRAGLRNPTPCIETPARVLQAIRFLGSVFRDCSPARSSSSTPAGLLTGEIVFFYSGGSSSWWTFERIEINYFFFFLVDVHGTALRTSSCID